MKEHIVKEYDKDYQIVNYDFASLYPTISTNKYIDEHIMKELKNDLRKKKLDSL